MKILNFLIATSLIFSVSGRLFAQRPAAQLTPAVKSQVVDSLSSVLLKSYVYRDTAVSMGNYIKKRLKSGDYNTYNYPNEFADALNADLHKVYNDRHLSVRYDPQMEAGLRDTSGNGSVQRQQHDRQFAKQQNFGFKKVEILSGNIGYIAFNRFFGVDTAAKQTVNAVFAFLKNTNALIIDLRGNGGGDAAMVEYICSYFFKNRTHLNDLYQRRTNKTDQFWTEPVSYVDVFAAMPVYVLVSNRTFSGAEEFAYDLQSLHRATIVGETTGGGAHPVGPETIGNGFIGNIPFAKAINPVTGKNWEAAGVKPDVAVSAGNALDAATLSYYDHQLKTSKDVDVIRTVTWSRDMLNARLHPASVDTAVLRSYTGNYADRLVTLQNGKLYYTGRDNKTTLLIAISDNTFKFDGMDNIEIAFHKNSTGPADEMIFNFDDGFKIDYKRK